MFWYWFYWVVWLSARGWRAKVFTRVRLQDGGVRPVGRCWRIEAWLVENGLRLVVGLVGLSLFDEKKKEKSASRRDVKDGVVVTGMVCARVRVAQAKHQQQLRFFKHTAMFFSGRLYGLEMVLYYVYLLFMAVLMYMVCLESQNSTPQPEKRYHRPPNAPQCPELDA